MPLLSAVLPKIRRLIAPPPLTVMELAEAREAMGREAAQQRVVQAQRRRNYDLGQINRLTANFLGQMRTFNEELRMAPLWRLRARCRELARNDSNAIKFLSLLSKNVIGGDGIQLQSQVKMQRGGNLNKTANDAIEEAWANWGQPENCTVSGRWSFVRVKKLVLREVAIEGELFVRRIWRPNLAHRFALQFLPADQCDEEYNELLPSGNRVVLGVEFNPDSAPVAYHIWDRPRGDSTYMPRRRLRIPASEILHLMLPYSLFQARGVPWMTGAAYHMGLFKGYGEAELVAAQVAACQMGVVTRNIDPDRGYTGTKGSLDDTGGEAIQMQPGIFAALQPGESISMLDPKHPNASFPEFMKTALRSIATGLDVAYCSLSADLSDTSYSSARVGLLDERETWGDLQKWMIDDFCQPIYRSWLEASFLSYLKNLPGGDWQAYYAPTWHPRSFPWVDPLNDINATTVELANGITTRTRILASKGQDFRDTVDELAEEQKYLTQKGVDLPLPTVAGKKAPGLVTGTEPADTGGTQPAGGKPNGKANGSVPRILPVEGIQ